MEANEGDTLLVHGMTVGHPDQEVEIVEVLGVGGEPPYRIRFEDGHEAVVSPGPDAVVTHPVEADQAMEMISPTEADAAALAAALRRTTQQLADARQGTPEFRHEMRDLLVEAEKHAEDLKLPEVAKALRPES